MRSLFLLSLILVSCRSVEPEPYQPIPKEVLRMGVQCEDSTAELIVYELEDLYSFDLVSASDTTHRQGIATKAECLDQASFLMGCP